MKNKFTIILSIVMLIGCFNSVYGAVPEREAYQLSTHILDVSKGQPASGVIVSIYKFNEETREWDFIDKALTAENGRIENFLPSNQNNHGAYKLRFETEEYFKNHNELSIYPYIEVAFYITDTAHYHIPITVSANGYSTYRGS